MNTITMNNVAKKATNEQINGLTALASRLITITQENINNATKWAANNEPKVLYFRKADGSEPNTIYCGSYYEDKPEYVFDHDEDNWAVSRTRNMKPGMYAVDDHSSNRGFDINEFRAKNPDCELSDIEIYLEQGVLSDIAGVGLMDDKIIGLYDARYFSVNPVSMGRDGLPHIRTASCGGVVKRHGDMMNSVKEYNDGYEESYQKHGLDMRRCQISAFILV